MDSISPAAVTLYVVVSTWLAVRLWRRDAFFATYFTALILYAIAAQIGYLLFPALSELAIRMYFGEEVLPLAAVFTTLSMLALYAAYGTMYRPLVAAVRVRTVRRRPSAILFPAIMLVDITLLGLGYAYFSDQLSYANASDEDFIEAAGLSYKLFWALFKFAPFSLIVHYAVVRQSALGGRLGGLFAFGLLVARLALFLTIANATGTRTDPLALMLGLLAFEYFHHQRQQRAIAPGQMKRTSPSRRRRWRFALTAGVAIALTLVWLTQLEATRGGGEIAADLDASALVQGLLLKDYYTPFHVLIGAMAHGYVDPLAVLASNAANALMFLKVPYLQSYVVEWWNPGSVTRAASPAMFAFTEGYVALGWFGWIYNGVVWSLGFALWRSLSRTDNEQFNAVAFALPLAMALVAARSQSSYFIKTLYLSYAPALLLYSLATGIRWRWPSQSSSRSSRHTAHSPRPGS